MLDILINLSFFSLFVISMRLSPSSFIYTLITVAGLIRAIQLYYTSTRDLHEANKRDVWYNRANKSFVPTDLVNVALQDSTRMDDSPDKIFYFLQVPYTFTFCFAFVK